MGRMEGKGSTVSPFSARPVESLATRLVATACTGWPPVRMLTASITYNYAGGGAAAICERGCSHIKGAEPYVMGGVIICAEGCDHMW